MICTRREVLSVLSCVHAFYSPTTDIHFGLLNSIHFGHSHVEAWLAAAKSSEGRGVRWEMGFSSFKSLGLDYSWASERTG